MTERTTAIHKVNSTWAERLKITLGAGAGVGLFVLGASQLFNPTVLAIAGIYAATMSALPYVPFVQNMVMNIKMQKRE